MIESGVRQLRAGMVFAVAMSLCLRGAPASPRAAADPGEPGPCTVSSQIVEIDGELETRFHFPASDQCGDEIEGPYPGVAFAHGFSMFGLTNGAADNAHNGEHLASWGYVVAIPVLPDDVEARIVDMQTVLSYLETETDVPSSFLYEKVDVDRLSAVGHSFGGATVLALAARDVRVGAVVALDPVYHQGGPGQEEGPEIWDHDAEGPDITVPTAILGAPDSNCNSESDYAEIYPFIGATHKASARIAGASHCDFMSPGDSFGLCYLFCAGPTERDPLRTQLIQKVMTAWLNYYLHVDARYYDYLYGSEAEADAAAGLIEWLVDTAPRGVTASGSIEAVGLEWELYSHPIVAGYDIYRRLPGQSFSEAPHAQVGRTSSYLDGGLQAGQVYTYAVCSRDGLGNLHQLSDEVSAVPTEATAWVYLPILLRSWP